MFAKLHFVMFSSFNFCSDSIKTCAINIINCIKEYNLIHFVQNNPVIIKVPSYYCVIHWWFFHANDNLSPVFRVFVDTTLPVMRRELTGQQTNCVPAEDLKWVTPNLWLRVQRSRCQHVVLPSFISDPESKTTLRCVQLKTDCPRTDVCIVCWPVGPSLCQSCEDRILRNRRRTRSSLNWNNKKKRSPITVSCNFCESLPNIDCKCKANGWGNDGYQQATL